MLGHLLCCPLCLRDYAWLIVVNVSATFYLLVKGIFWVSILVEVHIITAYTAGTYIFDINKHATYFVALLKV